MYSGHVIVLQVRIMNESPEKFISASQVTEDQKENHRIDRWTVLRKVLEDSV